MRWAIGLVAVALVLAIGGGATWLAARRRDARAVEAVVRTGPVYPALPTSFETVLVYHEDFSEDDGEWTLIGVAPFDSPEGVREGERLTLNALGSDYCLGYWESPAVRVVPEQLFRAVFLVSASTDIDRDVPQFRLRVSSSEPDDVAYQGVAMLAVSSTGTANHSPTETPRYYEVWFRAPLDTERIRLQFELLSFEGVDDDPFTTVRLEEAWVERVM